MKRYLFLFTIALTWVLVSCNTRSGKFKVSGRFLNLNQGEFYVYSPDGVMAGIDTIRVDGGRFTYETACSSPGTLMLVFPNFSEQPIFAEPGQSVSVKADASHLKEMTVEGTDDNQLMTAFRRQTADAAPPEVQKQATQFMTEHPASAVSNYLLRKYFVMAPDADYAKAARQAADLSKAQPKNGDLVRLQQDLQDMGKTKVGAHLPAFSGTDVNGQAVSNAALHGKIGVVYVWSTWNYESHDVQRRLKTLKQQKGDRLAVVGISIDASKRECREFLKRDSLPWPVLCDGMMFDGAVMKKLGVRTIPYNVVLDQDGKILDRALRPDDLRKKLEDLLK